ncbi:ATP-binding protein [Siphonobacter sp. SORGH_AS_1065]|uniref:sensor histidine kinase n=1 Tax=Siphonobacter sp. SORGH_AS_1065 TaxID=3041795 RepID=UPI00277FC5EE|nr:ATP-binding protein [Siphonobacter sp. SORGH_AS_1065]MDQ1088209.1 PAS domain S-box-containing protein [Siphonobacter sp. SORGH_AS_1065]
MNSKSVQFQYPAEFPEQVRMLEKLNLLFTGIVHVYDLETRRIIYINHRFTELLGYSLQELEGWDGNLEVPVLPDDLWSQKEEKLEALLRKELNAIECETRLKHKDQSERTYKTRLTIFREDEYGKPLELIGISEDITEQVNRYKTLLQQQEMHRITEQAFHFGSWEKNLETGELVCSDGLYKIMGHSPEMMSSNCEEYTSLFTFLDKRDDTMVSQTVQEAIRNHQPFRLEHRVLTQSGKKKVLMVVGRPVLNENGTVSLLVGSIADITMLRQYEQELRLKIEELQRSNGELEQFAYAASHDLQEPLRKISSFVTRLRAKLGDTLEDEAEDYMRRTLQAIDRMKSLIDALLLLSRVTRQGNVKESVSLAHIVQDVLDDLDTQISEKKAFIEIDELPTIEAVPVQMRQLFYNLLGNALKFTDPSRVPHIQLKATPLPLEEAREKGLSTHFQWMKITIKDNGIGFEPEYKERIFQVFQRLNGRSEFEGTGIGLALCRKIVEFCGGTITAESQLGQGTCFTFYLPAAL